MQKFSGVEGSWSALGLKAEVESSSRVQKDFICREEKRRERLHGGMQWDQETSGSTSQVANFVCVYVFVFVCLFFCFYKVFFIHLFICAYIVWAISHPCPLPPPSPLHPLCFHAEPVLPSSPILLKKRHKQ
jgi:Flp pilus assembly protein TadB